MSDPLREPAFLTEHQLRAVHPERDIFLTACPGSGKTRAAGVRISRLDDGRRVAACSYTNVGVEQLRRVINVDLRHALDARQFGGTLHTFLLRYVLYPFGHLAAGSDKTPRLFGDDANWRAVTYNGNQGIRLPINAFHFRRDGSLCVQHTPPKFPLSAEAAVTQGGEGGTCAQAPGGPRWHGLVRRRDVLGAAGARGALGDRGVGRVALRGVARR